jgi:hypothetical protein
MNRQIVTISAQCFQCPGRAHFLHNAQPNFMKIHQLLQNTLGGGAETRVATSPGLTRILGIANKCLWDPYIITVLPHQLVKSDQLFKTDILILDLYHKF